VGIAVRVLTIQPGFPFIRSFPWAKCDVQQSSDSNRTKHKPTRSGQPDGHVAEAVDAEENSIRFGDDVRIWVCDGIRVAAQLCNCKIVALLLDRLDTMGDSNALVVVDTDDVTDLNFRSRHGARECQSTGLDRGRHRSALEDQRSDTESEAGNEQSDGCQTGEGTEGEQKFVNPTWRRGFR